MASKKTINAIWSDLSTNRIDFSEEEIANGILYKGPVVSNQLNGVVYNLYTMLDFMQRTGALYNSKKVYYKNNVVSVIVQRQGEAIKLEYYRCLTDQPKGITNIPPIAGGAYDENADIPIFQGGATDTINWTRVDAIAAGNVQQTRSTFDVSKKIRLITLPEILSQSENTREISANLTFVVIFTDPTTQVDKTTTFTLRLSGIFVKDATGSIQLLPNRLGVPLPEIYYDNVYSDVTDYGSIKDFHQMMPYGLRLEYGWEGDPAAKQWSIYATLRQGIKSISVEGETNLCNVNLTLDSEQATTDSSDAKIQNIVIPIRTHGGFTEWSQIGQIVPDCSSVESNAALQYQKGYFMLDASYDEITAGTTKKLSYPEYGMYCRLKGITAGGSVNPTPIAGVFLRNLGEHKLPNFPQSEGEILRQPSSFQEDASRKISGKLDEVTTDAEISEGPALSHGALFYADGVYRAGGSTGTRDQFSINLDSSLVVPTTDYEGRPYNVAEQFYLKAF